jgi:hypothetical protein
MGLGQPLASGAGPDYTRAAPVLAVKRGGQIGGYSDGAVGGPMIALA